MARTSYEVVISYPDSKTVRVILPELNNAFLEADCLEELEGLLPPAIAERQKTGPRAYPTEPKK